MQGNIVKDKIELATTQRAGLIKPDGVTIIVDANGTAHAKGGGDLALSDVSGATASVVNEIVSLIWSDPEDVVISGVTVATWKGTKVVRKSGSAPDDVTDGTLIADITTRNQHSSTPLTDNTVEYGTTYYYRFFPYTTRDTITNGSSVSATPTRTVITVPTWSEVLTFDGTLKTPTFTGYNTNTMTVSGDTSATNAGSYTAIFTPKHDYMWSDSTTTGKNVAWSIGKAQPSVTLTEAGVTITSIELNADKTQTTVTIASSTGNVTSVQSSDSTTVTVSLSGSTISVNSVNDTSGTATISLTVSASSDGNYNSGVIEVEATASFVQIYGVEWDGSSTTVLTRTDAAANFTDPNPYYAGMSESPSSPFDNIYPWSEMTKVEDSTMGTMVKLPKFYYKWVTDSNNIIKGLKICKDQEEGFNLDPIHSFWNTDNAYVSRYYAGPQDYFQTALSYKSLSGVYPYQRVYPSTMSSNINDKFSSLSGRMIDFSAIVTIWMLYLVEFANWDSQAVIGYGGASNDQNQQSLQTGYTDTMPYHTGTMNTSRETYGPATQYRYLEGLWDNCSCIVDGLFEKYNYADDIVISKPGVGRTQVGNIPSNTSSGYTYTLKNFKKSTTSGFDWVIYPYQLLTNDYSFTNYISDQYQGIDSSWRSLMLNTGGGSIYQMRMCGLFTWNIASSDTLSYKYGTRTMKLTATT